MAREIFYILDDSKLFADLAVHSIRSLRQSGCQLPVTVIRPRFDSRLKAFGVNQRIVAFAREGQFSNRYWKTQLGNLTNADLVMHLDADTVVLGDLEPLWQLLESSQADFCASLAGSKTVAEGHQRNKISADERAFNKSLGIESLPFWNAGVFLFRSSPQTKAFFTKWHEEWMRFQGVDQFAMARAMNHVKLTLQPFDPLLWNRSPQRHDPPITSYAHALEAGVRILHFFGRSERREKRIYRIIRAMPHLGRGLGDRLLLARLFFHAQKPLLCSVRRRLYEVKRNLENAFACRFR